MDEKIGEKIAHWTSEKSVWTLKAIVKLQVNINKHRPLGGSQYIDLPAWIKAKKAVINVKNKDEECFKWAILSALHHDEVDPKQTDRVTQSSIWLALRILTKLRRRWRTAGERHQLAADRGRRAKALLLDPKYVPAGVVPDFGTRWRDLPVLQVLEPLL
ncbi:unnamed protein product [Mytilus edulis]|uniref:Uncharacterized protein n=1 Tax=Mytilus edulis TaxID=6550 RepID=A0A8S3VJE5_MYTED|nr:unnamed protein product [Mytilus edulis]